MDVERQALERGILLYRQDRKADAAREFRRALTENVMNAAAHAWLSLALLDERSFDEAEREAGQAIVHGPDLSLAHFAMACVQRDRGRLPEAHASIDEAIRLDGGFTSAYHGTRAHLFLQQRRAAEALDAANAGLAIEPDDTFCLNARALAQTQLGQKSAAVETIRGALDRNPENAFTHANHGWAMLHQGKPGAALDHFAEALKLDPNHAFARAGLVEALKAKNPIYRLMLAYFLWIGRQGQAVRAIVFVGALVGPRAFRAIGSEYPELRPYAYVAAGLLYAFILMTWLAVPIFNSMLRLHPRGRYAPTDDQRRDSTLFLGWVALMLCVASVGLFAHDTIWPLLGAAGALVLLPLSSIYSCPTGWPRGVMVAVVLVLAALWGTLVVNVATRLLPLETLLTITTVYLVGAFASQFIAGAMVRQRVHA